MMARLVKRVFGGSRSEKDESAIILGEADPYSHLRNSRGYVDLHTAAVPCAKCQVPAMTLCRNEYGDVCFERSQTFLKWARTNYEDYKELTVRCRALEVVKND